MSIDTANRIINEQEESISQLKHRILDLEDQRDDALRQGVELVKAMNRITAEESLDGAKAIACRALEVDK